MKITRKVFTGMVFFFWMAIFGYSTFVLVTSLPQDSPWIFFPFAIMVVSLIGLGMLAGIRLPNNTPTKKPDEKQD
jgi:hypothetical protein